MALTIARTMLKLAQKDNYMINLNLKVRPGLLSKSRSLFRASPSYGRLLVTVKPGEYSPDKGNSAFAQRMTDQISFGLLHSCLLHICHTNRQMNAPDSAISSNISQFSRPMLHFFKEAVWVSLYLHNCISNYNYLFKTLMCVGCIHIPTGCSSSFRTQLNCCTFLRLATASRRNNGKSTHRLHFMSGKW